MHKEILVIDDNPDIRFLICNILKEQNFNVRSAANFDQAVLEINKKLPELAIIDIINRSVDFVKMSSKNKININAKYKKLIINGDAEQLNRVFINLIKNSEEAFLDLVKKTPNFKGKIDIEIISNNDYIVIRLTDNGTGISDTKKVMTPYFTTKTKGTGLGLPIVSKIINEHSGDFLIKNKKDGSGVDIEISFPKINA